MEETKELLRQLHEDIGRSASGDVPGSGLRGDLDTLRAAVRSRASKFWTRLVGGLLALCIVVLAGNAWYTYHTAQGAAHAAKDAKHAQDDTADLARRQAAQLACITAWARKSTARTQLLLSTSQARNNAADRLSHALEDLLRAAIRRDTTTIPALERRWLHTAAAYDKASATYRATLRTHPVPVPQLACAATLRSTPRSTATRTVTAAPPPPVTRTATATRPASTVTGTVTVTAAGRTVTAPAVTTTRTVTATRTVPAPLPPSVCRILPPPLRQRLC